MSNQSELDLWLRSLPIGETCQVYGEAVMLSVQEHGAELALVLHPQPSPLHIANAMRAGFQGAMDFTAGLGVLPQGGELVLSRWLEGVDGWCDIAEHLEALLNQAAFWRSAMNAGSAHAAPVRNDESRARRRVLESL